ncbi:hypothetical protein [Flavobacterium degerlachei]|jgi:hypothetical protein|uniref:TonB protein C-terminal n=1 Tax=Flavobacterium degerlachei TaxID=229203 RepID=A0A1H2QEQ1_9FLAO|nr:hypothetical protein [Flavobacterium degerlachei]SDW05661.1 hypothetical protein SAMN05444338_101168 [Flavobacterium degerlachei]
MKNILFAVMLIFSFSLFAQNNNDVSYLKIKQNSCIKKKGNSLVFKEVLSDSRCPEGVNCIWAGEIKVVVAVYLDKNFIKEETLIISGKNSQENIAWITQYLPADKRNIESINVFPYPKEGVKIKSKKYFLQIAYIK